MEPVTQLPEPLLSAGVNGFRTLDVRSILQAGGDPFSLILKTVRGLQQSEALHLIAPFDPIPLYAVMNGLGRAALAVREDALFHVWFYSSQTATEASPESSGTDVVDGNGERAALQEPTTLDVRGLEPPEPMIAILQRLVDLGPGAQLLVRHHREPVLLYDKLQVRGYAAKCTAQPEGDFLVHIAPAWVFEEGAG